MGRGIVRFLSMLLHLSSLCTIKKNTIFKNPRWYDDVHIHSKNTKIVNCHSGNIKKKTVEAIVKYNWVVTEDCVITYFKVYKKRCESSYYSTSLRQCIIIYIRIYYVIFHYNLRHYKLIQEKGRMDKLVFIFQKSLNKLAFIDL